MMTCRSPVAMANPSHVGPRQTRQSANTTQPSHTPTDRKVALPPAISATPETTNAIAATAITAPFTHGELDRP